MDRGYIQLFAADVGEPVRWRLLRANNREAGRSVASFPDAAAARLAAERLQAGLSEVTTAIRRTTPSTWSWQIGMGGRPEAVSGRSYDRMIRCTQALQAFLDTVAAVRIADTVLVSNVRRWQRWGQR